MRARFQKSGFDAGLDCRALKKRNSPFNQAAQDRCATFERWSKHHIERSRADGTNRSSKSVTRCR